MCRCSFVRVSYMNSGIHRAELKIKPANGASIENCIIHEGTHGFGFLCHPTAPTAFRATSTSVAHSRRSTRILYASRLPVGTRPAAASQLACRILGEPTLTAAADIEAVCTDRKGPSI